ncbi:MAG: PKD domain-containing protein, partial [bacterium]|nr:PKD domain-containing protein [bacterium]
NFNSLFSGDIISWWWDFGDGETSADPNPTHTYDNPGTYTASLAVEDNNGCRASDTFTITVNSCVTELTLTKSSDPVGDTTCTREIFKGEIITYHLNYEYGAGPQATNVLVTDHLDPGVAVLTTGGGLYDPLQHAVIWNPGNLDPGDSNTLTFTAEVTVDSGACIQNQADIAADNAAPFAANVITHYVKERFMADFAAAPTTGCAPLIVDFNDLSTGGDVTSWSWDLDGDGVPDTTAQNPTCIYTEAGDYLVTLTVNGACCDPDSTTRTIHVDPLRVTAAIKADFKNSGLPVTVCFTDVSTGAITSRTWILKGGLPGSDLFLCQTYTEPGIYKVKLIVSGPCGADVETMEFEIKESVEADFTAGPLRGCLPLTVYFNDISTGAVTSRIWDFGDGGTSPDINPVHVYNAPGV